MPDMLPVEAHACTDRPDPRDWASREVCGSVILAELPREAKLQRTAIQDQSLDALTGYACTIFGLTHCSNEGNALEAERTGANAADFPLRQAADLVPGAAAAGWFDPKRGAALQDALKWFRDGPALISGWARCASFDDCVAAIARGNPVFTGSARANWKATAETGVFTESASSYGHAFALDAYRLGEKPDQDVLIVRNSYGPKWAGTGRCALRRENFPALFSCYEVFDRSNDDIVSAYRKSMEEKQIAALKAAGVTNGERPGDTVTRREAWLMLARVLDPKVQAAYAAEISKK